MVRTMTLKWGSCCSNWRVASKPLREGMPLSTITTSGYFRWAGVPKSALSFRSKSLLGNRLIGIGDGQNYDFEVGVVLQQLACGVQAVEGRHASVHDRPIRLFSLGWSSQVGS